MVGAKAISAGTFLFAIVRTIARVALWSRIRITSWFSCNTIHGLMDHAGSAFFRDFHLMVAFDAYNVT